MAKSYYVKIPSEGVSYGPYSRSSALQFARIGSAHGQTREVWKGCKLIRRYAAGKASYRGDTGGLYRSNPAGIRTLRVWHAKRPNFGFGPPAQWPGGYELAAEVDTDAGTDSDALEDAFRLTTSINAPWWQNARVRMMGPVQQRRSTSVGDVVELPDGTRYIVLGTGWQILQPTKLNPGPGCYICSRMAVAQCCKCLQEICVTHIGGYAGSEDGHQVLCVLCIQREDRQNPVGAPCGYCGTPLVIIKGKLDCPKCSAPRDVDLSDLLAGRPFKHIPLPRFPHCACPSCRPRRNPDVPDCEICEQRPAVGDCDLCGTLACDMCSVMHGDNMFCVMCYGKNRSGKNPWDRG